MATNRVTERPGGFVLTAEALEKALPAIAMATKAVHADNFFSLSKSVYTDIWHR
jgi:hypothetical protein